VSLREWQTQLGQALLLPNAPPMCGFPALHGLEDRRLALYNELISNTLLETLQSIYPYTYHLLSDHGDSEDDWKTLAGQYRRAYPNQSHKLMDAVSSFPNFLSQQSDLIEQYPFLADLAEYEWLEMEVMNLSDQPVVLDLANELPPVEEWDDYRPVWNPAGRLQHFQFNIPEMLELLKQEDSLLNVQDLPPAPVDILIYRDPETLDARFFCLNALTALLMQLSQEEDVSYLKALMQLQEQNPVLQSVPLEVMLQQAVGLFTNCLETGMLLGSQRLNKI
jgi:hypothetical protein